MLRTHRVAAAPHFFVEYVIALFGRSYLLYLENSVAGKNLSSSIQPLNFKKWVRVVFLNDKKCNLTNTAIQKGARRWDFYP